jgi:tetratricopeptide (TPR) repeat protein
VGSKNKTGRAARLAGQAARLDPGPLTLRLHAAALREAGLGARSLEPARAALAVAPDDPDAAFSVARSLVSVGRVDEALADLEGLLGRVPDHGPALRLSGELLLLRDPGAAERRLRRACQVEPLSGRARLLLSTALDRQGREEEAEDAERAGLAMDAALREAHRGREAARAVGLVGLVGVFALSVAFWALTGQIERYWPGFGPGPTLVLGMLAPLLPLLLIGWLAARLAVAQVEPPDPDLEALERVLGFERDSAPRG